MRIQHNILAMNAYRNYNNNTSALSKNLEKLSSGYKINRAGDDAAGLAISEKMRAQITGLSAAQKNVKDGISLVKTAEGAMQEIQDMLNRMDYLATQSANGTYDDPVDRLNLQKEVTALKDEINRIADSANFNGIKLLDGSLDSNRPSAAASAVSNIVSTDFAASGASPAFNAEYVINRPEPSDKQYNATFKISLDDISLSGLDTGDSISLTVGDNTIKFVKGTGAIADASALATALSQCGVKYTGSDALKFTDGNATTGGAAPTSDTEKYLTSAWDANATANMATEGTDTDANLIKVDGHWYTMSASGSTLTFTQVDYMGKSGQTLNLDYQTSIKAEEANAAGTGPKMDFSGTINPQVQDTSGGKGIGSAQQAQVNVKIDFSQLKDGDILVVGEKAYSFQIGENSTAAATAANGADGKPTTVIDLSDIFAKDSDLADEAKQQAAMMKITDDMAAASSATWSAGNKGVDGGVGTLTFQSLSTYAGDKTGATTGKVFVGMGTGTTGTLADMRTESSVMAQFVSKRGDQNASTSFDLDVTKIKEGDTITIDGTTFEFTAGDGVSTKGNVEVDLSAYGIGGDIAAYNAPNIMNDLKTAINNNMKYGTDAMYDITIDGNKMTLTANDNAGTASVKENKTAPKVELPAGSLNGRGLTLQIGDTPDTFNQITVAIGDMHTSAMGTGKTTIDGKEVDVTKTIADIDISNIDGAREAIAVVKNAINYVSGVRGDLGAVQNRLEHTQNNLSVMAENIQDAESTIRDTDVAEEMMAYTKNNILIQSAQAMLAQANQVPQGVLQLLG